MLGALWKRGGVVAAGVRASSAQASAPSISTVRMIRPERHVDAFLKHADMERKKDPAHRGALASHLWMREYALFQRAFIELEDRLHETFQPKSVLVTDLPGSQGAGLLAAHDKWGGSAGLLHVIASSRPDAMAAFEQSFPERTVELVSVDGRLAGPATARGRYDLICVAFDGHQSSHGALPSAALVESVLAMGSSLLPGGALVIVEPLGAEHIGELHLQPSLVPAVHARVAELALAEGPLCVVAPCMHAQRCPLQAEPMAFSASRPRNCTFAQRYERRRTQKLGALRLQNSFGSTRFAYLCLQMPADPGAGARGLHSPLEQEREGQVSGRILTPPRKRSGHVLLDLCTARGELKTITVSRAKHGDKPAAQQDEDSHRSAYRSARRGSDAENHDGAADANGNRSASHRPSVKLSAIGDLEAHVTQLQTIIKNLQAEHEQTTASLELARAQILGFERERERSRFQQGELLDARKEVERLGKEAVNVQQERDEALADAESVRTRAQALAAQSTDEEEQEKLARMHTAVPGGGRLASKASWLDDREEQNGWTPDVRRNQAAFAETDEADETEEAVPAQDEPESEAAELRQQLRTTTLELSGRVEELGQLRLELARLEGRQSASSHHASLYSRQSSLSRDQSGAWPDPSGAPSAALRKQLSVFETKAELVAHMQGMLEREQHDKCELEASVQQQREKMQELHSDLTELGSTLQSTSGRLMEAEANAALHQRRLATVELVSEIYLQGFVKSLVSARGKSRDAGPVGR